jgi:hypothetical protein
MWFVGEFGTLGLEPGRDGIDAKNCQRKMIKPLLRRCGLRVDAVAGRPAR